MSEKMTLTEEGDRFHRALNVTTKWLALGGEIKLEHGHVVQMTEEGEPGIIMHVHDTHTGNKYDKLCFIGDDTWILLVHHARKMDEKEIMRLAANLTLNETDKNTGQKP